MNDSSSEHCLIRLAFLRRSKGIHNYAPRHLDQAVAFLAKTIDRYPYEEVIGPTFDLADLSAAMKVAGSKVYSRVLVKPSDGLTVPTEDELSERVTLDCAVFGLNRHVT